MANWTDIYIVFKEPLKDLDIPNVHLIDIETLKGKKEGWKLKNYYGAKLDPFAVIMNNKKTVRAFYSEAEDVIKSLKNYINYESKSN